MLLSRLPASDETNCFVAQMWESGDLGVTVKNSLLVASDGSGDAQATPKLTRQGALSAASLLVALQGDTSFTLEAAGFMEGQALGRQTVSRATESYKSSVKRTYVHASGSQLAPPTLPRKAGQTAIWG